MSFQVRYEHNFSIQTGDYEGNAWPKGSTKCGKITSFAFIFFSIISKLFIRREICNDSAGESFITILTVVSLIGIQTLIPAEVNTKNQILLDPVRSCPTMG